LITEFATTNELRLLIHCCRLAIEKQGNPSVDINYKQIDWDFLLKIASINKVRPLLLKGIYKWEYFSQVPQVFIHKLKSICFKITLKNLKHTQELIKLIQLFKEINIEVLPYKGVILAQVVYVDLNAREYSDLDLLIALKDLEPIKNTLINIGYKPELDIPAHLLPSLLKQYYEFNFSYFENGQRIFHVEPHWLIGPKMNQLQFTYKDFQAFIVQKKLLNTTINTLNPTGLLLSTCLHHGGQDKWKNFKQVCDLAAILTQFSKDIDWQEVLTIGRKWKVENLILVGCGLAASFFTLELPEWLTKKFEKKKINHFIQLGINNLKDSKINPLFSKDAILQNLTYHLSLRANWLTKLKIIYFHFLKFVLPNENDIDLENRHSSYFGLFLKKPIRIWRKYFSNISDN